MKAIAPTLIIALVVLLPSCKTESNDKHLFYIKYAATPFPEPTPRLDNNQIVSARSGFWVGPIIPLITPCPASPAAPCQSPPSHSPESVNEAISAVNTDIRHAGNTVHAYLQQIAAGSNIMRTIDNLELYLSKTIPQFSQGGPVYTALSQAREKHSKDMQQIEMLQKASDNQKQAEVYRKAFEICKQNENAFEVCASNLTILNKRLTSLASCIQQWKTLYESTHSVGGTKYAENEIMGLAADARDEWTMYGN